MNGVEGTAGAHIVRPAPAHSGEDHTGARQREEGQVRFTHEGPLAMARRFVRDALNADGYFNSTRGTGEQVPVYMRLGESADVSLEAPVSVVTVAEMAARWAGEITADADTSLRAQARVDPGAARRLLR